MRAHLNARVKHREWFRPYAPVVPLDDAPAYFDLEGDSPYMLVVHQVRDRHAMPAITHVDNTARVQTLAEEVNPRLHQVLRAFGERAGSSVLLNTSFNHAGEPIVERPAEAIDAYERMGIDLLVMGERLVGAGARRTGVRALAPSGTVSE
jgi:carbamoyltransferase